MPIVEGNLVIEESSIMRNTSTPKITLIQQMGKVISILLLATVMVFSFNAPSYATDSLCTSVTSNPRPQPGQNNRSSGNFSDQECSGPNLKWMVPGSIRFNVMLDRTMARDPVLAENVIIGQVTRRFNERNLYIANPSGATENFLVNVLNTNDPQS